MRSLLFGFVFLLSASAFSQNIKTTLSYLVHQPSKVNKRTPVLIVMHGYGSDENDLLPFSKEVAKNFIIFSLQAPQTVAQGGHCWYELEFLPNQKFKYNYKQAENSRAKILSFISNACAAYHVDSTSVFLLGFSQGASMAYEVALSNPQKIKGVLALSGLLIEETKNMKTDWGKVAKVKMLVAHGTADNIVNYLDAEKCRDFLKSKNIIDFNFLSYPSGHSLHPTEIKDVFNWLEKHK